MLGITGQCEVFSLFSVDLMIYLTAFPIIADVGNETKVDRVGKMRKQSNDKQRQQDSLL